MISDVYLREKRWIRDVEAEIDPASNARVSWFLARVADEPAGVIRLAYDPPLEMPADWGFRLERHIDASELARCRFVEVGRFMILPHYRRRIDVALRLMRAAVGEVVERGYSHLLTDVFESDPHSPLKFHTRVLGFERIGSHRLGELSCESLRIVLVLDLARSYRRLKERRDKVFRELAAGFEELLERLPQGRGLELAS